MIGYLNQNTPRPSIVFHGHYSDVFDLVNNQQLTFIYKFYYKDKINQRYKTSHDHQKLFFIQMLSMQYQSGASDGHQYIIQLIIHKHFKHLKWKKYPIWNHSCKQ